MFLNPSSRIRPVMCTFRTILCLTALANYAVLGLVSSFNTHYQLLRDKRNTALKSQSPKPSTPYVSSLIKVRDSILPTRQYFFPGHSSGRYLHNSGDYKHLDVFQHDLPELDGLDNIHAPEGPLLESLELAARLYGSKKSWFLVNGSTGGLLSCILAFAAYHRKKRVANSSRAARSTLVVTQDAHKAVFDALWVAQCDAIVLPCAVEETMGISLGLDYSPHSRDSLEQVLIDRGDEICGFVLTRPTYQGVMMDAARLKDLAALLHRYNVPLLVDEAHGGHLCFLDLPDALQCGADVVVQSSHKTLTALSQCAMMHLSGDWTWGPVGLDDKYAKLLQQSFSALTSTSPNAFLLASLDAARAHMDEGGEGRDAIRAASEAAAELRECLQDAGIATLDRVLSDARSSLTVDPLRLTLRFPGQADATVVDDWLCDVHGIYCELNLPGAITYVIPPGATTAGLKPLRDALVLAAEKFSVKSGKQEELLEMATADKTKPNETLISFIDTAATLAGFDEEAVSLASAVGRIAAETVCTYPPGIPIVIRGERLVPEKVKLLISLQDGGGNSGLASGRAITGAADPTLTSILVYTESN